MYLEDPALILIDRNSQAPICNIQGINFSSAIPQCESSFGVKEKRYTIPEQMERLPTGTSWQAEGLRGQASPESIPVLKGVGVGG